MAQATQLTVRDAAEHVGVTRQTIFKQIKAGRLSATTDHRGQKQINITELLRVYGTLQSPEEVAQNKLNRTQQPPQTMATAVLQLELERAKMQLERKDFELSQMRERVDELKAREREATEERLRLFGILEQQTRLLTAPTPAPKPSVKPAAKAPRTTKAPAKAVKPTARATTPVKRPAARKSAPVNPVATAPARSKTTAARSTPAATKAGTKKATRK